METETLQVCAICGENFKKNELITTADNDLICQRCLDENNYYSCENCGKVYHIDDMHSTNDGYYCERCFEDNYIICDHCGGYERKENSHSDWDNSYCNDCYYDYYFTCDDCGGIYHIDDLNRAGDSNYCNDCINQHNVIKEYGYTPDMNFLNDISENLYYGFELEVSGDEDYAKDYLEHFDDDEQEIFLTYDSSIGCGFEITSQPMTYNYFKKCFEKRFADSLNFLRKRGFTSHNVGGLHIHTSRKAWTNKQLAQLHGIMYGNDNDINTWLQITQRTEYSLEQWASMRNNTASFEALQHGIALKCDRYTAINFTNSTVEFRIFNGNLRIERFLKNLECVKALYDFTRIVAENSPKLFANTSRFLRYVLLNNSKYPNLHEFITSRNIYNNHINNNKSVELENIAA